MVQKSQTTIWDGAKTMLKYRHKLPTSTGEFTGFQPSTVWILLSGCSPFYVCTTQQIAETTHPPLPETALPCRSCRLSVWKVGLQRFTQQDTMNGFCLPGHGISPSFLVNSINKNLFFHTYPHLYLTNHKGISPTRRCSWCFV